MVDIVEMVVSGEEGKGNANMAEIVGGSYGAVCVYWPALVMTSNGEIRMGLFG